MLATFKVFMKILVIRYKFIGDVLMTSVICNSLKQTFPQSQVDYMVHDISASLFANHPYIDNVIPITISERHNPWQYFKTVLRVAKHRYDIIIDASSIEKTKIISLLSPQATYRIGRKKKWRNNLAYTHAIPKTAEKGDKIEQRLNMLAPLENTGINVIKDNHMIVNLTDSEKGFMRQYMVKQGIDFKKTILAFSVSAKLSQKKWRSDYMQQVVKHCLDKYDVHIVLYAGAEHELHDIKNFHQKLDSHPAIFSNIKTNNIRDLAALFANCHMFIGNEGGPRHISQALDLPSVAIFSPSADRVSWLPCKSARYRGIEWRDVFSPKEIQQTPDYEYGDSTYFKLYNSITPSHVIPIVDDVFETFLRFQ